MPRASHRAESYRHRSAVDQLRGKALVINPFKGLTIGAYSHHVGAPASGRQYATRANLRWTAGDGVDQGPFVTI